MKRDRLFVVSVLVFQALITAVEMQAMILAVFAILITVLGLTLSRHRNRRYESVEYQQEVSQALQTLANEPLWNAVKRTIGARVFWKQLFRLLLESQFGRRLVLVVVLLTTVGLRVTLRLYDPQQSSLGAICQLVVPAMILGEAVLFLLLLQNVRTESRRGLIEDGQLLLPLSCGAIILLVVHHQFLGQPLLLLFTSIGAAALVAALSHVLVRGRWLGKFTNIIDKRKRISTSINIPNAKFRKVARPTVLIYAAFGTLSWILAVNLDQSVPSVQGWMANRIYGPNSPLPGTPFGLAERYVEVATLSSVREQLFTSPQAVAFRVYCAVPPGYLRGRAFEVYRGGRWGSGPSNTPADRGQRLLPVPANVAPTSDGLQLSRFQLASDGSGPRVQVEVRNDPTRGNFFFCPLNAVYLEGRGDTILVDRNQIPLIGLSVRHPYRSLVYKVPGEVVVSKTQRELCLRTSEQLTRFVKPIANRICGDYPNARSKAAAIQRYFRSQFTYSLDAPQPPSGEEPIEYFLKSRHGAHCEYFATGAALMLRAVDVPCRYVTGYVVDELADSGDYWIARNRNAHAWVEAYDDTTRRWFIVEATPGRNANDLLFPSDEQLAANSAITNLQSESKQGFWRKLLDWISASDSQYAAQNWLTRARLPLAIIVLFLLFFRFFDPLRRRYWHKGDDLWYQRVLKTIDRQAAKRGLTRLQSETLNQFANRIQKLANDADADGKEKLLLLAKQYRRYSLARYSGADWNEVQRLDC